MNWKWKIKTVLGWPLKDWARPGPNTLHGPCRPGPGTTGPDLEWAMPWFSCLSPHLKVEHTIFNNLINALMKYSILFSIIWEVLFWYNFGPIVRFRGIGRKGEENMQKQQEMEDSRQLSNEEAWIKNRRQSISFSLGTIFFGAICALIIFPL